MTDTKPQNSAERPTLTLFPSGTGELATLIRDHPWRLTSLNSIDRWPQSLKTATELLLRSAVPMVMLWGADRVMIYNDAYAVFAGGRHPGLLGSRVREGWPEVADFNDNVMRVGLSGGVLAYRDQELTLHRSGRPEQVWMDLDYSPVPDESGRPGGVLAVVMETTDRVRAERELSTERDRSRRVLDDMGEGYSLLDRDFRILDLNAEALRLESRPRSVLVGQVHWDAYPGTEHSQLGRLYKLAMAERRPVSLEHRHTWEDGRSSWLDMRAYPVEDGLAIFFRDISDRKQAESARDRADDLLQTFLKAVPGVVYAKDRAGLMLVANQGAADLIGRPMDAFLGKTDAEFLADPDQAAAVMATDRRIMETGRADVVEEHVDRSDGTPAVWLSTKAPLRDLAGEVIGLVGASVDVSEQVKAREVLARSRDELEREVDRRTAERDRLWRNTQDMQVVIDGRGAFQAVSPAFTRILGWTPEEVIGRTVFDFVIADDTASTGGALAHARAEVLPTFENRYRHKDGGVRRISWVATPENELIYASGRNITAEKEQAAELAAAQEALRQSQKMEAVGQLTGGIAHDFNNLLTGITGSLEIMQTRIAQGRLADVDRYMNAAQGAAKRAAALTHRLLAFSRRQTLDPKPLNVNRLIGDMEELIRRTIGPNVHLEVVGAGGLWPTLADPNQLENALLNLCINARDAMPEGGRITIETANKWLDDRAARERDLSPGQYLSLCVTDTGTGMEPEVVARAFDPFFTTKPLGVGTGLGLSMIYGFVRQTGGQVRIYTEPGQGTTMCLYLPRYDGEAEDADALHVVMDAAHVQGGETVLVVDDEPTVRMLVAEVLREIGFTVIEAEDGAAGLRVLQGARRVDLLITDVGLPGGMNGRQVADAARVARPGLRVLFITGYAENAAVGNGHLDKGMAVLTKPFAVEALGLKVKEVMG